MQERVDNWFLERGAGFRRSHMHGMHGQGHHQLTMVVVGVLAKWIGTTGMGERKGDI